MRVPRRALRWMAPALGLLLVLFAALAVVPAPAARAAAPADCAGPIAGRHVYDCAGVLTPGEVAALEQQAAAVQQAGAPTIIYLRLRDADQTQTVQDAANLMELWSVESAPGAHDGFVMFFNLRPGDPRHGEVGLYAGEKHVKDGALTQSELERIVSDDMTPPLRDGRLAAGISAGLTAVAHNLRYGPPPPSPEQTAFQTIGRFPYNVLALLALLGTLLVGLRFRQKRQAAAAAPVAGTLPAPGELPPALAGALVRGRTSDAQMEATILDFAHRGMLVIEPVGYKKVQMRLASDGRELTGYEALVWQALEDCADMERVVQASELPNVRRGWGRARRALREELERRGWFDARAGSRRVPYVVAGAAGVLLALLGLPVALVAEEGWALIGVVLFGAAASLAFVLGYALPATTPAGEQAAAPWRAARGRLEVEALLPPAGVDLDAAIPYVIALSGSAAAGKLLRSASDKGYSPAWFRPDERYAGYGFYPYWVVWHAGMYPTSSGGTGGVSAGGAASGGAGAGGSF
jgi:uncharacterized membrane protein YgcG